MIVVSKNALYYNAFTAIEDCANKLETFITWIDDDDDLSNQIEKVIESLQELETTLWNSVPLQNPDKL